MKTRVVVVLILICATTWIAYNHLQPPTLGIDDAHIFFIYGKNIAAGQGIVFNSLGSPVEGYTSTLWTVIVTLAFFLTNQIYFWLLTFNILLLSSALIILWRFIDGTEDIKLRGLIFIVWVFSSPSFIIWMNLSLMDTILLCVLLIFCTLVVLSNASPHFLTLLIPLLLLTRPEGIIWALMFICLYGLNTACRTGIKAALKKTGIPALAYIATLLGLTFFRLSYFGYPLPNTYYAKVSPDLLYNLYTGAGYLFLFIYTNLALLVIVPIIIVGIFVHLPTIFKCLARPSNLHLYIIQIQFFSISLIILTGLLIPVITGGDHFRLFRFFQPIWPLLILPVFYFVDVIKLQSKDIPGYSNLKTIVGNKHPIISYGIALLIGVLIFSSPTVNWLNHLYYDSIEHEFRFAETGKQTGNTLNEMFVQNKPSIGVITAGGIGFTYKGLVIDLMGLNNVEMAHSPGARYGEKNHAAFNTETFFKQTPQILLPQVGTLEVVEKMAKDKNSYTVTNYWLKGLLQNDQFLRLYNPVIISKSNKHMLGYVKQDYIQVLLDKEFVVKEVPFPPH